MGDNITITPGTGATIAADEVNGALVQRVKPCVGDDGVAQDVSQDNPMPVQLADVMVALLAAIERLNTPMWVDPVSSRVRVNMEYGLGSNLTLAVTTGSTSTLGYLGGTTPTNTIVADAMMNCWSNTVRRCIT
jgi:hypothetical protein